MSLESNLIRREVIGEGLGRVLGLLQPAPMTALLSFQAIFYVEQKVNSYLSAEVVMLNLECIRSQSSCPPLYHLLWYCLTKTLIWHLTSLIPETPPEYVLLSPRKPFRQSHPRIPHLPFQTCSICSVNINWIELNFQSSKWLKIFTCNLHLANNVPVLMVQCCGWMGGERPTIWDPEMAPSSRLTGVCQGEGDGWICTRKMVILIRIFWISAE